MMSRFRFPLIVSALLAGLGAFGLFLAPRPPNPDEIAMLTAADPNEDRLAEGLVGLWTRHPDARGDGDPVRFYFFHDSGIGLYRFGKIGLNTTNSFDWRVVGNEIELTFRKTGEVARTGYRVDHAGGAAKLWLDHDPREPLLGSVSYVFVPPPATSDVLSDLEPLMPAFAATRGIGGRLWIDVQKFTTGGSQFSLYQLRAAAIDGRGVGWHHIGDFDDWSTEALHFRDAGDLLELSFNLRGDKSRSRIQRKGDELLVEEDPRSFWHVRRYKDGGPSFGAYVLARAR
jgi:hypothetical protein